MIPQATAVSLIAALAGLLAIVSALAGALWWRARSAPLIRVAQLARELTERQRALEELIERWERSRAKEAPPPGHPAGPRSLLAEPSHRIDPPQESAIPGPTLIAVPDLSAPPPPTPAADAEADLARRFGAVWEMARRGDAAEGIARATGQPIGQVELILGLRRQLAAASEA